MKVNTREIFNDFYKELRERNIEYKEVFEQDKIFDTALKLDLFYLKNVKIISYVRSSNQESVLVATLPFSSGDDGGYVAFIFDIENGNYTVEEVLKAIDEAEERELEYNATNKNYID